MLGKSKGDGRMVSGNFKVWAKCVISNVHKECTIRYYPVISWHSYEPWDGHNALVLSQERALLYLHEFNSFKSFVLDENLQGDIGDEVEAYEALVREDDDCGTPAGDRIQTLEVFKHDVRVYSQGYMSVLERGDDASCHDSSVVDVFHVVANCLDSYGSVVGTVYYLLKVDKGEQLDAEAVRNKLRRRGRQIYSNVHKVNIVTFVKLREEKVV